MVEDAIEGLDIFLREMQEKACEDNERTVVLNAPRGLVCEESEFLLEARSRYVRNVLSHKDIGVGYDGVTSEFAMLMPARYVGSNARDGGNGVEVGFLHVVFKTAKLAKTVIERFDKCCPTSTGGIEIQWGNEVYSARMVAVHNVAWVMGADAPEWMEIELTRNPVWRVAVAPIGISPNQEEMVQKWGGFAVKRLNGKLREWGVDGELGYVAMRPVFSKGSKVAKGLMLTVEVLKEPFGREPWVVPNAVNLKEGMPTVRLLWIVKGVQRHNWEGNARETLGPGTGPPGRWVGVVEGVRAADRERELRKGGLGPWQGRRRP